MIDGARVLGLVTARGGSKGLPGKNLRDLCGRPLIAWSIDAVLQSQFIDDLVVSTDSQEIANAARGYGAEVPFLRPHELATDTTTSVDVIVHAISWLQTAGREYGYIVLIEPTSPLREPQDIDAALRQMVDANADAIVSVCRAETTHPVFMYRRDCQGLLTPYAGGAGATPRRQDTEPVFFLEGTVYASKIATLLEQRTFCHEGTLGYEVPKWKSPEIDDIIDFLLVESIIRHRGINTGARQRTISGS
jgi:N-acylneuraminate cytidylyltransferase/CMP-N,N'-diacetyllegionaminic acid synthase